MPLIQKLFPAVLGLCLTAAAPPPDPAAEVAAHWRALTRIDVEAAHRLLLEDHPGAVPEAGDTAFRARLEAGYAAALQRTAKVSSYEGYQATLAAFAVAQGDKHIWSRPLFQASRPEWAGILVVRRAAAWTVAYDEDAADGAPLKGSTLVSCDGIPADRLGEERLGTYRAVWSIEAQRVQRAPMLLIDDGNPFLVRPRSCTFSQGGEARTIALKWRAPTGDLSPKIAALGLRGAPGFGVRKVGDGWWIALQSLSEKALPVVEQVRAEAEAIRAAPFVVLDLRGNGGGNSRYGRLLADALLGEPYVEAALGGGGEEGEGGCHKAWRLSERNMKQLLYYRDVMGPRMGKEAAEQFAREYDIVAAAKAKGLAFSSSPICRAAVESRMPRPRPPLPPSAMKGRLILLTDNSCFSSCLMVTDDFRRLGALHVGETTDANTHYMEVREEKLPSGLSMFSTLQAIDPSAPPQIGPFVPAVFFDGSIADTAALEAWVPTLLKR